ncbi:MAG: hypothetical protein IAG10_13990 [Planctomycetaceae bacterium]|nr:hypothetical protein [Planctomycetaceae bacterium]
MSDNPSNSCELTTKEIQLLRTIERDYRTVLWVAAAPLVALPFRRFSIAVVIIIPLATLLFLWRLAQWHWLAAKKPALLNANLSFGYRNNSSGRLSPVNALAASFRKSRIWLWAGSLFWPAVFGGLVWYFTNQDSQVARVPANEGSPTAFETDEFSPTSRR